MNQLCIELQGITKSYDGEMVLDHMDLGIKENEFVTLLGPSGCGKTTTLRIMGGFEIPNEGKVLFEGKDIAEVPANKRPLNTVFQKYALFSHMDIEDNIAFGLKIKKKSKGYIHDKIKYALKLVNLSGYEKRMPDSLSGGQQQRIAIARAIVNEPKILLLDEPLGALDLKMRQDMQYELIRLKDELGITFVYVTHDQEEALTMSDKIVVMNQGLIQQIGTPEDVYNEPQNAFVADFIGESNIISATMVRDKVVNILGQLLGTSPHVNTHALPATGQPDADCGHVAQRRGPRRPRFTRLYPPGGKPGPHRGQYQHHANGQDRGRPVWR